MRVAIGADHAGFLLKRPVIETLEELGHTYQDFGTYDEQRVDYPDMAALVCRAVLSGECDAGILICGTGIGMSLAANRFPGIRATLCHESYTARMAREHSNGNVLCIGGRVLGEGVAREIVKVWMSTSFAGGRHADRLAKVEGITERK